MFVWLVVLVFFQGGMPEPPKNGFQVIEFFCGDGAIGKSCQNGRITTAMLDIKYGAGMVDRKENPFDITTSAGFAFLGG